MTFWVHSVANVYRETSPGEYIFITLMGKPKMDFPKQFLKTNWCILWWILTTFPIPAHISLNNCFDLLASCAPNPALSQHAKSFKASVASPPHQPPAAAHNSACPLGRAGREGRRARTPRTPKHPEQLEVQSSYPASQQNNQNTENL